jgi:hypothetical protein
VIFVAAVSCQTKFPRFEKPNKSKCFTNLSMSAIRAPAQEGSDLVMIAEESNKKFTGSVLEDEAQLAVASTLEKFAAQLADAETAMHVRLPEGVY